MISNLRAMFRKIGAEVCFVGISPRERPNGKPVRLNIVNRDGKEQFEVAVRNDENRMLDVTVLEVLPADRHLVLLARQLDSDGRVLSKDHFLCGHDERHLFVAAVKAVSTVAEAKASLKPREIRIKETGLNTRKRNRRKTEHFRRQGEWFFIPVSVDIDQMRIRRNEPLQRPGSKAHIAQFAARIGGEHVKVCPQYPGGISPAQYEALLKRRPNARHLNWRDMWRQPTVYVKGTIRHPDHATIKLDSWHRVLMNVEERTDAVRFLD